MLPAIKTRMTVAKRRIGQLVREVDLLDYILCQNHFATHRVDVATVRNSIGRASDSGLRGCRFESAPSDAIGPDLYRIGLEPLVTCGSYVVPQATGKARTVVDIMRAVRAAERFATHRS